MSSNSNEMMAKSFRYTCALFAIVVVGTGLGGMTQTALNTSAVVVLGDLGSDIGWGQWLTTLYIFAMGAAVPLASFLQRRLSIRTLMLVSYSFYLLGSLCDLVAMDIVMLLIGRVLEALSTGILMPLLQTIAMTRFPENRHGTAMGVAGIALGFAPNMGPVAGGAICEAFGWRAIFLILLVASVLLLLFTALIVRERKAADPERKLDRVSLALSTFGFGGMLFGFTAAANMGIGEPLVWAPVVIGAVAVWAFVRRQRVVERPLINMRIFDFASYGHAMIIQCMMYGCFVGMTLIIPLVVIEGIGATAFEAGLVLFPGALAALIFEPGSGAASDRFGVRKVAIFGGCFLALGAVGASLIPLSSPLWVFAVFQTIRCIGLTTLIPCTTAWGLSPLGAHGITPDGSSALIMMRQIFAAFATAVMVFLLRLAQGFGNAELGFHMALGLSGVLGALALVFAIAFVRNGTVGGVSAESVDAKDAGAGRPDQDK